MSNIDRLLVIIWLILVAAGWANIYSVSFNDSQLSIFSLSTDYGKQMLFIGISIIVALFILLLDAKWFVAFSYWIYFAVILLLIGVLLFGKTIAGSRSWFQIGSFSLQPSELAKFATSLALARFLSTIDLDISKIKSQLLAGLIIFVPIILIFFQNDTGSALVYFSLIIVLYREGMSGIFIIAGGITVVLFICTLLLGVYWTLGITVALLFLIWFFGQRQNKKSLKKILITAVLAISVIFSVNYVFNNVLEPHQRQRINVLLNIEQDLQGAGYNVHQSLIAIGSGGFTGKGYMEGTQTKLNFVPEQKTDFIFCTIGEEWGFLGSSLLLITFVFLIARIIIMAERQRSSFARIYGYCVASIFFFHVAINIGMTLGLVPTIGIPLPFFSYGGSSLIGFTVLLFIFIKQDANRLELL
ncbi:MAG: rod shape-determining protein RodA [Bacteroidales bacterium]|nr:rod shape-determining protein RodA [Bacteroidales bacterium]